MRRTLAALLLGGAVILGCSEKPEPKLFFDPITGTRIQETPIVKEEKPVKKEPPKEKNKERYDPIIVWGKRYETSFGDFEIDGKELHGIILTGEDGRYGSVPLLLDGILSKRKHGVDGYQVIEPKEIDDMYGMDFGLPDKLKNSSKEEVFQKLFVEKIIGNKNYSLMSWKEKVYNSDLKRLESLNVLIFERGVRTNFMSNVKNGRVSVFSNFYVPVKIKD